MSRFAGSHSPTMIISRLISRDRRARVGLHGVGSRIIAALVSAAVLFAARASVRFERDPSAAFYSAAATLSQTALHSEALRRGSLGARLSTRRSTKAPLDTALPARAAVAVSAAVQEAPSGRALEPFAASVAVRGYDATAPPTLS